ncbi:hypothetical protein, partial [Acinetobacter baumannii]
VAGRRVPAGAAADSVAVAGRTASQTSVLSWRAPDRWGLGLDRGSAQQFNAHPYLTGTAPFF